MRLINNFSFAAAVAVLLTAPYVLGRNTEGSKAMKNDSPISAMAASKYSLASKMVSNFQLHQYAIDQAMAPIKTRTDLANYRASHPHDSLFTVLLPLNRRLFFDSIQYNAQGNVTGLRYDVLESLTPTQAFQILSMFGMQQLVPQLHLKSYTILDKQIMNLTPQLAPPIIKDYWCAGRGTCSQEKSYACNSGTC